MNKRREFLDHIYSHRATYAFCAGMTFMAILALIAQVANAKEWNSFLKEHDLFEAFYDFDRV